LGLGMRAGHLVIGVDGVRNALQRGEIRCLVLASDASPRATQKTLALAQATKVAVVQGPSADELGMKLGRPPVMAVGVRDRDLAKGIQESVKHD
ncbi:MAG: ribosomal L7Ae/L30e/S12e/Gadd45 family protein, partial [Gemmatimonadota bacterium]